MVKFGSTSLGTLQRWRLSTSRYLDERFIPGRTVAYREDLGGSGYEFDVDTLIYPYNYTTRASIISAMGDQSSHILDLELSGFPTFTCLAQSWETVPQSTDDPLTITVRLRFVEYNNP